MNWYKRNPVFYTALLLMVASMFVSGWFATQRANKLEELVMEYEAQMRQLDSYVSRPVAPTRANLEALENNYALLHRQYERVSSLLNLSTYDQSRFFGETPESSTEAFFEIAAYISSARKLIASKEIDFDEETRFGFSAYANKGPSSDAIETVHRQVKVMEVLIQALAESGISEFQRIQREEVFGEESHRERRTSQDRRDSGGLVGDIFHMHEHASVKREGVIETLAFRVSFKGQSLSLRSFLNRIVNSSLPLVIRGIEVEVTKLGESAERVDMGDNPFFEDSEVNSSVLQAARVPIISENESTFIVTLEFLDMPKQVLPPSRPGGPEIAQMGGSDV